MNIMKKWLGSGGSMEGSMETSPASEQHLALGMMHLKKLFSEFSYPTVPLSEVEKEDKLYAMLPLFCKVSICVCACICKYMSIFCHKGSGLSEPEFLEVISLPK